MVREIKQHRGALFDDTPRGMLEAFLVAGGITIALSTAPVLLAALAGARYMLKTDEKDRRRKLHRYGLYLTRKKYVAVRPLLGKRARVELTPLGKRRALHARARRLLSKSVERPNVWDKKWRLILFDIAAGERSKRDAFRAFIRRIGAVMLQKSVWVHPFDCSEHVELLRGFFGLSTSELRLVVADKVENDSELRRRFNL